LFSQPHPTNQSCSYGMVHAVQRNATGGTFGTVSMAVGSVSTPSFNDNRCRPHVYISAALYAMKCMDKRMIKVKHATRMILFEVGC
jgi:hypothetical protein